MISLKRLKSAENGLQMRDFVVIGAPLFVIYLLSQFGMTPIYGSAKKHQ